MYTNDSCPRIAVVQLDAAAPAGLLPEALTAAAPGAQVTVLAFDAGASLPDLAQFDSLVLLGGNQDAYDPALLPVRDLLNDAVGAGMPTLALCLGAQLLAVAAGGAVEVSAPSGPEFGVVSVRLRPDAATDPVLGAVVADLGRDVLAASNHADAVTNLPAGATWLASSEAYPFQAFRIGPALGLQFHPEADRETWARWCADAGAATRVHEWDQAEAALRDLAAAVARGFVAQQVTADA